MKQNIYDDPAFFASYLNLRLTGAGLNEVLEWPALRSLLPSLAGKRVLDLGCGYGWFCRVAREQGAASVVGVDISENMLRRARATNALGGVTYVRSSFEDAQFKDAGFDLAVSSLAFHYVADFGAVCAKIARWLAADGRLVFSVEHPIMTASPAGWCPGEGTRRHWPLDRYREEGRRDTTWFVDGVIKYHRTIETYINTLLDNGFAITRLLEPEPALEHIMRRPELRDECRRPPFLLISARRAAAAAA